jgi:hypothetical protein
MALKNLQPGLIDIVEAIAVEIKNTRILTGDLNQLRTANREDVVKAINSLYDRVSLLNSPISDTSADDEASDKTWSGAKTRYQLNELRTLINNNAGNFNVPLQNLKNEILGMLDKYVRHDAPTSLSESNKSTARSNIGAADRRLGDVLDVEDSFTTLMKGKLGYKNITGVVVEGDEVKTLKLIFDNNSVLTATFNDINLDPTKLNSISFDHTTGILKAVNPQGTVINVLLDGRYVKISDMDQYALKTDPRFTDERNAKDVKPWAKADTKPEYTWEEIKEKPGVLKFGTEAEKGNVKVVGDKIYLYDGSQWVEAGGGDIDIVHYLNDTNKDQPIPAGKVYVVVETTADLEVTTNADFLIYVKRTSGLKINSVVVREGWAYVVRGIVTLSHPFFDLLQLFNDTYNA